jgi:hypothetical protein
MLFTSSIPILYTHSKNQLSHLRGSSKVISFSCQFPTIESFYTQRGGSMETSYREFENYWENKGKALPVPELYLYIGKVAEFNDIGFSLPSKEGTQQVIAVFWSIGKQLEMEVSNLMDNGNLLNGLILDVVGSRILVELHTVIQNWLKTELALPMGWNIIGENYPEESRESDLQSLLNLTGADKNISLISGTAMLTPQKTQYSLFLIGEGEAAELKKTVTCSTCMGRRCPYWQMGGCHIS